MNANLEQFSTSGKAAVDSLLCVANTALASAERVAALNLSTSRQFVQDSTSAAKAVFGAKDPQAAMATIQSALVQPSVEIAVAYTKALYQISADAHQELSKLFESQFAGFQKTAGGMLDNASKSAPAGSEALIASVKAVLAKANAAFDTASTINKSLAESTQATVAAVTATK